MKRLTAAIITIMVLICGLCFGEEPQDRRKLTDEEIWDIYYEFIAEVKPYGIPADRKEHEEKCKPELFHREGPDWYTRTASYVKVVSPNYDIARIDASTGEIRLFVLTAVDQNPAQYVGKVNPPARLTEQEVIEKTKRYLSLVKESKLELYTAEARYKRDYWIVTFRRTNGEFAYAMEAVVITYSEKYGILGYSNALFSDECKDKPQITKEKAEALGEKYLSEKNKGWLEIPEVMTMELTIVNPAILKRSMISEEPFVEGWRKARLAWIVTYKDASGKRPITREWIGLILVYIDAITGDLIVANRH